MACCLAGHGCLPALPGCGRRGGAGAGSAASLPFWCAASPPPAPPLALAHPHLISYPFNHSTLPRTPHTPLQVYAQQIESLQAREASALSCVRTLEGKLKSAIGSNGSAGDAPPALAAPGYKWVLVKEGQEAAAVVGAGGSSAWLSRQASSAGVSTADESAEPAEDESVKVGGSLLWGASSGRPSGGGGGGAPSGRPRDQQVAALQQQVRELEATRERLSEELVRAATEAAAGQAARAAAAAADARLREAEERLAAAVELLGEKEELLEEAQVGAAGRFVGAAHCEACRCGCARARPVSPAAPPSLERRPCLPPCPCQTDMVEMREHYRQQIDFMATQLTAGQQPPPA